MKIIMTKSSNELFRHVLTSSKKNNKTKTNGVRDKGMMGHHVLEFFEGDLDHESNFSKKIQNRIQISKNEF